MLALAGGLTTISTWKSPVSSSIRLRASLVIFQG